MADQYGGVPARYLEPRKKGTPSQIPAKAVIPTNPAYQGVESRYHMGRQESPKRGSEIPKKLFDSTLHEQLGKRIYRGVQTKYCDPSYYQPNEQSPRRRLEEQRHIDERLYGWRNDTMAASKSTFDDHMKLTKKRWESLPVPKKNFKAPSMIKEYVLHNTPIRHYSMAHLLETDKDKAGSEKGTSRANSPSKREAERKAESPGRLWTNAGWQNQSFDARIEEHSAARKSFALEQKRVSLEWEKRKSAVVSRDHVPRVAALSPAAKLKQKIDNNSPSRNGRALELAEEQSYSLED